MACSECRHEVGRWRHDQPDDHQQPRDHLPQCSFERACHSIPFFFGLGNHEAEYGYLFTAAADKQNNIPAWDLKARKAFYPAPTPDTFYTGNPTPKGLHRRHARPAGGLLCLRVGRGPFHHARSLLEHDDQSELRQRRVALEPRQSAV
jgi:hypothetical protein